MASCRSRSRDRRSPGGAGPDLLRLLRRGLGDLDRAFEYPDRAYAEEPGNLTYFRADPTADSLKDDPCFAELMRKLGLE